MFLCVHQCPLLSYLYFYLLSPVFFLSLWNYSHLFCDCVSCCVLSDFKTFVTCLYISMSPWRGTICVFPASCALLTTHFSGCILLTLSVWSVCSLMEVARAKCRAPSCCLRHPRWHALCPSPCPTLKSSARPLTADSAHPHLRVSHPELPNSHYRPSLPTVCS